MREQKHWLKFIFSGDDRVDGTKVFNPERVRMEVGKHPQVRLSLRADGRNTSIKSGDILYIVAYATDSAGKKRVFIVARGILDDLMTDVNYYDEIFGFFESDSFEYLNAPIENCIDLQGLWDKYGNKAFPNSEAGSLKAVYSQANYVALTEKAGEWIDDNFFNMLGSPEISAVV